MPILKKYRAKPGYYIQCSIHGSVVTMQVTSRGVERLIGSGFAIGERFPLKLLAALSQTGDAFTRGTGAKPIGTYVEADQFEFDFEESRESESLFPKCEVHGTFDDLELVIEQHESKGTVRLLSPTARMNLSGQICLSIPLWLLSQQSLQLLEDAGRLPGGDPTVEKLRSWFAQGSAEE